VHQDAAVLGEPGKKLQQHGGGDTGRVCCDVFDVDWQFLDRPVHPFDKVHEFYGRPLIKELAELIAIGEMVENVGHSSRRDHPVGQLALEIEAEDRSARELALPPPRGLPL
jgi:hypothetical protein